MDIPQIPNQQKGQSMDAEKILRRLGEQVGLQTVQIAVLEQKLVEANTTISQLEGELRKAQGGSKK